MKRVSKKASAKKKISQNETKGEVVLGKGEHAKSELILVKGDISSPEAFMGDVNRRLAEGASIVSIITSKYTLLGFLLMTK